MQTCRKPKNIKTHNQRLVLNVLRNRETMTAGELAGQIHLSITTVTKILSELQAKGLVRSMGKGASTEEGGKRPELYALDAQHRYVVSVTAGRRVILCALLDLKCCVVGRRQQTYKKREDYGSCMEEIASLIRELCGEHGIGPEQICGIAVGLEGIVDEEKGIFRFPIHNREWGRDLLVREDLERLLPGFGKIAVDNGSRYSGYGELFGHPEYASCRVVSISTGSSTGGCVLENGRLLQGANGLVGELGHIQVRENGKRKCACGNYGCFETSVSPEALLEYAAEAAGEFPDSAVIKPLREGTLDETKLFAAAQEGDPCARFILDRAVTYFSMLIRDIILLYDPHVIVLQGIYAESGPYFLEKLKERVRSSPFFKLKYELEIVYSELDFERAAALGGGLFCINRYFAGEECLE